MIVAVVLAAAGALFGGHFSVPSSQQPLLMQSGPNPIPLENDQVNILKANLSERSTTTAESRPNGFWIQKWSAPDQVFRWHVIAKQADEYEVAVLVSGAPGSTIEVQSPENRLKTSIPPGNDHWGNNWNKIAVPGALQLPEGESVIAVSSPNPAQAPTNKNYDGMALLSLELVRRGAKPDIEQRIRRFRSNPSWLADAKYGLMFQWGEWGYPQHGEKKQWPKQIDDFNVNGFAKMLSDTGAAYVIWSPTWRTYYFPAPIKAIDSILPGRTSKRDLIGDLAEALDKYRIKLFLYYNCGYGDKEWRAKNWTTNNTNLLGVDPLFRKNWMEIMTQVGRRYGKRLSGWFIDEGFYPSPFELEGKALKAGNQDRIISYNDWVRPRLTEFEDVEFGEAFDGWNNYSGQLFPNGPPQGGAGVYHQGPFQGLQAHGMFILDGAEYGPEWGIWKPETRIAKPRYTQEQIVTLVRNALSRRVALSFNLLMFEDGTVSPESLHAMQLVRATARGHE